MRRFFVAVGSVVVVACPGVVWAQGAASRGWVDVNVGVAAAAQRTFTMSGAEPLYLETLRSQVDYRLPTGADFDFGFGVRLTRAFGLGLSFSGTAHQDAAQLFVQVPHPLAFDAFASDTAPTDQALTRSEGGAHIQFVFVAPTTGRLRVRVFGGPTFFRVEQEGVDVIEYNQVYGIFTTANNVTITTYRSRKVDGSGWGFHAGADVSWFFNRVVGIGAIVRFSRGSVSIENTIGTGTIDVKAGGVQAGGGLRLRF